jgi:hypothetical protein
MHQSLLDSIAGKTKDYFKEVIVDVRSPIEVSEKYS